MACTFQRNDESERMGDCSDGSTYLYSTALNAAAQITSMSVGVGSAPANPSWTYDTATGRMTKFNAGLNNSTYSGTLTWNQNSSLQSLVIADTANAPDAQTCTYTHDDLQRIASAT